MTSISATRSLQQAPGEHVRINVYAGPDEGHRANAGTLTCRENEAAALLAAINTWADTITGGAL